jgi:hypothetical protein
MKNILGYEGQSVNEKYIKFEGLNNIYKKIASTQC